jgi:hypothetical protein
MPRGTGASSAAATAVAAQTTAIRTMAEIPRRAITMLRAALLGQMLPGVGVDLTAYAPEFRLQLSNCRSKGGVRLVPHAQYIRNREVERLRRAFDPHSLWFAEPMAPHDSPNVERDATLLAGVVDVQLVQTLKRRMLGHDLPVLVELALGEVMTLVRHRALLTLDRSKPLTNIGQLLL